MLCEGVPATSGSSDLTYFLVHLLSLPPRFWVRAFLLFTVHPPCVNRARCFSIFIFLIAVGNLVGSFNMDCDEGMRIPKAHGARDVQQCLRTPNMPNLWFPVPPTSFRWDICRVWLKGWRWWRADEFRVPPYSTPAILCRRLSWEFFCKEKKKKFNSQLRIGNTAYKRYSMVKNSAFI